jgi:hypothetical protein
MPYCHPCIADLVLGLWFKPAPSSVVMCRLNPIPGELIAFACTALKCALDEWASGEYKLINFSETAYHKTYVDHRAYWRSFEEGRYRNRCRIIATDMTKYCMQMCGVKMGKNGNILEEEEEELRDIQENSGDIDLGDGEDDILPPGYE